MLINVISIQAQQGPPVPFILPLRVITSWRAQSIASPAPRTAPDPARHTLPECTTAMKQKYWLAVIWVKIYQNVPTFSKRKDRKESSM